MLRARSRARGWPGRLAVAVVVVTTAPAVIGGSADDGDRPVIAVYGDSYSAGGRQGGEGEAGWPARVAGALGAELRLHAAGGAGYATGSTAADETFLEQVRGHPEPAADVVVVFGSRNDTFRAPAEVGRRAAEVFDAVRAGSPSAVLVVIGPAWDDDGPPAELLLTRDAVATAAGSAAASFVDPLAGGWLLDRPELVGTDGVHPDDAGHAHLAELIGPAVRAALLGVPAA